MGAPNQVKVETINESDAEESLSAVDDDIIEQNFDDISLYSVTAAARKTVLFAILVFVMGTVVSAGFLWYSISSARTRADNEFERRSNELVRVVESSWRDYEVTSITVHSICKNPGTTKDDFRDFYEHLVAGGIEFQAVQCVRNVTHEERPTYESISREYYGENYADIDYQGFRGFDFAPDGAPRGISPRSMAPFYFTIVQNEPVVGNEAAIDLDIYSKPSQAADIEKALITGKPVLGNRLTLAQETENAYGVILRNPGIHSSSHTQQQQRSRDLSALVIRIPSLLTRVARLQEQSLAAYLYEVHAGEYFLGAAAFYVDDDNNGRRDEAKLEFLPEQEIDSLRRHHKRLFEEQVEVASATWTIVVVPVDGTYNPDISIATFGGLMIFCAAIGLALWMYTNMRRMVEIYETKAEAEAERSIVSSMFPESVRVRLIKDAEGQKEVKKQRAKKLKLEGGKKVPNDIDDIITTKNLTSEFIFGSKPIAEFYPEVTIMCADLVGFTAWSSVREPSQVFTLLEIIYYSFDAIASHHRVFKVETVGDCYVAAAGIPDAVFNHAMVMAKFATACLHKVHHVTSQLETILGPDTGDLNIRIGLHSGACTAGVLRGDKGRFQLFGDTINTAAQMESSGLANRIQVSSETADLIQGMGKGHWLIPRGDKVSVKGKGHMDTFWFNMESGGVESVASSIANQQLFKVESTVNVGERDDQARFGRLVSWNVEELSKLLKQILGRRAAKRNKLLCKKSQSNKDGLLMKNVHLSSSDNRRKPPLEEVKDVIQLPQFDAVAFNNQVGIEKVELDSIVLTQLTDYVTKIGSMYNKNPFHNFEHASHVAMSVAKLLSRIVHPKQVMVNTTGSGAAAGASPDSAAGSSSNFASDLHDFTFGITSDPMTQFAAFFSALIHDVDHPGVPNDILKKEQPDMAKLYNGKSVAEQNSVDIAWDLLMQDDYKAFRSCLFGNEEKELLHFRQLIVNMVMATDVMDKELGALRKARWNKAFEVDGTKSLSSSSSQISREGINRRATIVIEHLIQASDVSHTMQHWRIYKKWNERLFMELYHAYTLGRIDKDPSESWYEGEKGFLDFYVIPLAKKLDTCGVFGVSSDEFRIYATENRKEWDLKGQQLVKDYLKNYEENFSL